MSTHRPSDPEGLQAPRQQISPVTTCRTCKSCRRRKVKCDGQHPKCGTCRVRCQTCEYPQDARKTAVRTKKADIRLLQRQLEQLKSQTCEDADQPASIEASLNADNPPLRTDPCSLDRAQDLNNDDRSVSPYTFDSREIQVYGATNLLRSHSEALLPNSQEKGTEEDESKSATRSWLISHAAITRQTEIILFSTPSVAANIDFDGVSIDMAMHLLDLHWNRQHLSYLLTYRPAIMESLINNGPYMNKLLLNAIYLQSSLYSDRTSLYLDPQDPQTLGMRFYDRFKTLLVHYIDNPTMPTVVALLTCGTCLVPHGKQSAGWLYCGMAYRMITDLGYHLDITKSPQNMVNPKLSAIDIEIRRRVYWGAYIGDKFQSLFLGRPPGMHQSDGNISYEYFDSYEEMELWKPYIDLEAQLDDNSVPPYTGRPSYALSTFQSLLQLSMIAERIIDSFYLIKSTKTPRSVLLRIRNEIREQLDHWRETLPTYLQFEPNLDDTPPPHQITPHTTYWTLVILTEQAFLNRGHFHFKLDASSQTESRDKCIGAALKIWRLVEAYKKAFTLRRAQYGISYATYCAVLVMLQQAHQDHNEYIECIQFFWIALLELQRGCSRSLRTPLRLLQSLMRRVETIAQRINIDEAETAACPSSTSFQAGMDPVLGPDDVERAEMDAWGYPWFSTVTDDLSFADDSIFGIFTQE